MIVIRKMKMWRTGLLAMLLIAACWCAQSSVSEVHAESAGAQFVDPALEWLVRQETGIREGDIPLADVQRVEKLVFSYEVFSKHYTTDPYEVGRVERLDGLEQLTGLEELHLWDFHALDKEQLSILAKLPNLKKLVVWDMQLDQLDAIGALKQLEELQLSLVTAPSLDALRGLDKLESLWIESSAAVGDYRALGTLKQLRKLEMIASSTSKSLDPQPITQLSGLQELTLLNHQLVQYDFLRALGELERLDLRGNPATDYEVLEALPKLKWLVLGDNVTSLEMVRSLTALETLIVDNGQVHDLTPLTHLEHLTELMLNNQQIEDLSPLHDLNKLEKLYITGNQVRSLAPLANLKQLQVLVADHNPIADAAVIPDLTQLRELRLAHTGITDVAGWESLVALEAIDLRQNVVDVEGDAKRLAWKQALLARGAVFEYDRYDPLPEIAVFIYSNRVYANGVYQELAAGSFIKDSRTFVPLRFISEQLGAHVQWDAQARTILIEDDQTSLLLTLDSSQVIHNGKAVQIDTAPEIQQDTAFVPLRFLSEQLGLRVQYHQYYPSVAIYRTQP